eukprot:3217708-Rhodomonas_salina.2
MDNKAGEIYSSRSPLVSYVCHDVTAAETPINVYLSTRRTDTLQAYTFIDTASQGHVVVTERCVRRRTGRKLKLKGVTGAVSFTEEVEISVPAPTQSCVQHTFKPCGPSMFTKASSDNILSHALLKQQGY